MIDLFKKAVFTGIGFAALTKDKVEELAQDLVAQGNLTEQEGKKFVDEILLKSKESQQEMSAMVEGLVQQGLAKMDVARKSEIETLREEVAALRQRLTALEMAGKTESSDGPASV